MPVTLSSNTSTIINSLQLKKAALPRLVDAANVFIENEVRITLNSLYPTRVASLWQTLMTSPGAPRLAMLTVSATDILAYWYEFGTQAHFIFPVNALALKFPGTHEWAGLTILTDMVDHPGAVAHNKRFELQAAMATSTSMLWRVAIEEALAIV